MIIRILMFPVILLLVMYFVIGQVVPIWKSVSAEKQLIIQKEESLAAANSKLNSVKSFVQSVKSHSTEVDFVNDFVPNDQREEILLSDVSQLAEKTGVSLFSMGFAEGRQDVKSSAATDQASYLIEGKMLVSGTYESVKKFSNELFHLKRLYAFKTFELTKVEKKDAKEGEEDAVPQEQLLSGVITFAYGYIPGEEKIDPTYFNQVVDYDLIDTVMNSSAETDKLVTEPKQRVNPFLP